MTGQGLKLLKSIFFFFLYVFLWCLLLYQLKVCLFMQIDDFMYIQEDRISPTVSV